MRQRDTTKEHPGPSLFLVFINDVQLTVVNLCSVSLYTVYTDAILFCNYSNIKDRKLLVAESKQAYTEYIEDQVHAYRQRSQIAS